VLSLATPKCNARIGDEVAIGAAGSGAAPHFHAAAWNLVVYGAKRWFVVAPGERALSKAHALTWAAEEPRKLRKVRYVRGDATILLHSNA
jgi:hypothetical protein